MVHVANLKDPSMTEASADTVKGFQIRLGFSWLGLNWEDSSIHGKHFPQCSWCEEAQGTQFSTFVPASCHLLLVSCCCYYCCICCCHIHWHENTVSSAFLFGLKTSSPQQSSRPPATDWDWGGNKPHCLSSCWPPQEQTGVVGFSSLYCVSQSNKFLLIYIHILGHSSKKRTKTEGGGGTEWIVEKGSYKFQLGPCDQL